MKIFFQAFGIVMMLFGGGVQANEDELPSSEFLEFLGQWETTQGEWVDPQAFMDDNQIDETLGVSTNETSEQSESE